MRRPRFKLDGPSLTIRGTAADGRVWHKHGRPGFVLDCYLQGVLAGTVEPEAQAMKRGTTWHKLCYSPTEARDALLAYRLGGVARVRGCLRIRASRRARGLPVTTPDWEET